jgi:hypothetical protein
MSQAKVVMDIEANGDGMINLAGTIIFGLSFDVQPVGGQPPSGNLTVMVGDCLTVAEINATNGVTFFSMNDKLGGTYQIDFPAGLKLLKGLSAGVSSNGHGTITVTIDHA